jgi:hypothetical protein
MIQVIDGKRYNTDTATRVFQYWNGYMTSDFKYRTKSLYLTSKGAWFLHHVGGAMTDMAETVGNSSHGSECIEPVTADDAYGFLEAHSDDSDALDAMNQYFADKIVDA